MLDAMCKSNRKTARNRDEAVDAVLIHQPRCQIVPGAKEDVDVTSWLPWTTICVHLTLLKSPCVVLCCVVPAHDTRLFNVPWPILMLFPDFDLSKE